MALQTEQHNSAFKHQTGTTNTPNKHNDSHQRNTHSAKAINATNTEITANKQPTTQQIAKQSTNTIHKETNKQMKNT